MLDCRKGQAVSQDLMLALLVLFFLVGLSVQSFNDFSTKVREFDARWDLLEKPSLAAFRVLEGPGWPDPWNSSNVQVIGLSRVENVVTPAKFSALENMSNASLKTFLGVEGYHVFLNLTDINNATLRVAGEAPATAATASSWFSHVVFNNSISVLWITVWVNVST